MHFKALALAALATAVSAQQAVPESVKASVLSVLVTAVPTSVLQAAVTNQPAFIAEIASSVSAGKTPDWYKPLPSDVKTYLTQIYPIAAITSKASSLASVASSKISDASSKFADATSSAHGVASTGGAMSSAGMNSTSVTSIGTPTLSSTGRPSGSYISGVPLPSSAARVNAATVGSGIAGALGVIGMLLL